MSINAHISKFKTDLVAFLVDNLQFSSCQPLLNKRLVHLSRFFDKKKSILA